MSRLYAPPNNPTRDQSFPKSVRLLRPREFRKVYEKGWRYTCPIFSAFCLQTGSSLQTRFGFTLPRAVGKANVRNRIKRRVRELVRRMRLKFPDGFQIVFNPRRVAYDAPLDQIAIEIDRLAARCRR